MRVYQHKIIEPAAPYSADGVVVRDF